MPATHCQKVKSNKAKSMCRKPFSIFSALAGFAASVFFVVSLFVVPAAADNWRTYHNDRYGTTIDYPDQFKAKPPPDSDDGRTFKGADGATFSVYASYNALDFDLKKFQDFSLKNLGPGQVVTYQSHGQSHDGDWFVISGTSGDNIFYERHLLSHGGEMTEGFSITYPAAANASYDAIVARMAKSLRPGKGFQTP
jgi:serine/threonine-protein kinase